MTNYGKSNRLHALLWPAAAVLGGLALNANAALTMTNIDGIEYRQSGNIFTWGPASPESTAIRGGTVVKSDLSVSTTAPKAEFKTDLPYKNKGGASAKTTMTATIDPSKVGSRAAQAMSKAAKGAGYFGAAAFACDLSADCTAAVEALVAWGASQFKKNDDGSLTAVAPDTSAPQYQSDGYFYGGYASTYHLSPSGACSSWIGPRNSNNPGLNFAFTGIYPAVEGYSCSITVTEASTGRSWSDDAHVPRLSSSMCPAGSPVVGGVCNGPVPTTEVPLQTYINSRYTGKGWDSHWAQMTAAIVANGGNVFTDGTSVDITGPAIVPISTSTTKTPVNVVPGTTTPAPPGHTGPTDSGTSTTTTSTSTSNTFQPAPFTSPGSGSSGGTNGKPSGPSLTTTQVTTTSTTVTNNITNNTSTTVINNTTETDDPPKEDEKDFCEKNPKALACAELDTPEQDIPRDKVTISYEYADIFGNGACPADSYLNTHGQTLKVWDWQASCDHIQDYFRPVLIACCAFAAFVIISAGVKE